MFYTKGGRVVRDGGGVEADIKVAAPQASVLEVSLQQQGVFFDFANEWAKSHTYSLGEGLKEGGPSLVTEQTYDEFLQFVKRKEKEGTLRLDLLFSGSLEPLKNALKATEYAKAGKELEGLREAVREEVQKEFLTEKKQIKEEVEQAILARYLPESMLRRLALEGDPQVKAAIEAVRDGGREGREAKSRYWEVLKGGGEGGRMGGEGGKEGGKKGEVVAAMEREVYEKEDELRLNGKVVWYGGREGGREEGGRQGRREQQRQQQEPQSQQQQQQPQEEQQQRWPGLSPPASRRSSAPPSSPAARVPAGMDRAWS